MKTKQISIQTLVRGKRHTPVLAVRVLIDHQRGAALTLEREGGRTFVGTGRVGAHGMRDRNHTGKTRSALPGRIGIAAVASTTI